MPFFGSDRDVDGGVPTEMVELQQMSSQDEDRLLLHDRVLNLPVIRDNITTPLNNNP
jgi:hypothetical protein